MILDSETKAVELPEDHGDELRLWLRLLTCTTLIEGEVRSRLRERFDVTLPRFDLMAQLDKVPDGMTLSDVSKRMMVSNGNVTGLVERLVESGHRRSPHLGDRPPRAGDPADQDSAAPSFARWRKSTRSGSPRSSPTWRRRMFAN